MHCMRACMLVLHSGRVINRGAHSETAPVLKAHGCKGRDGEPDADDLARQALCAIGKPEGHAHQPIGQD